MKFVILLVVISVLFSDHAITAESVNYPVSAIPDSLLKNAKSVVREYNLDFELVNLNYCKIDELTVLTILDNGGSSHLLTSFPYTSEVYIDRINITIYDKDGIKIKSFGRSDMNDQSEDFYGSIYSDFRRLYFDKSPNIYPFTVKYEVSYIQKYSFSFPVWNPLDEYNQSIQHARLNIKVPEDYKFSYKVSGPTGSVTKKTIDKSTTFQWNIENLPAVKYEAFAPDEIQNIPRVMLSPSKFVYDKYSGDMSSWKDYGLFINTLIEGRNDISDELKLKVRQMTDTLSSTEEKVKTLYRYLQNTTRYVSIQVGIGGLQPFPASTVEKYGYGDCKALSNYMKALLEAAGINAYYSLIQAKSARYYYDTSFVHDPYNHIILNVPLEGKDLWLECTSQITPFGFLGDFTDDRYALVITKTGGVLKKTSEYSGSKSIKTTSAEINLGPERQAKSTITTLYSGLYYDNLLPFIHFDYERQKDYLYDYHSDYDHSIDIPDFKISSFTYNDFPEIYPKLQENLELDLINYTSVSGSRMFVPLNLLNKFDYTPKNETERVNPILIRKAICETDSICFVIPDGYTVEFLPPGDSLETRFGKIDVKLIEIEGRVIYCRDLVIHRKEHPKDSYPEFVDFCKKINKLDNLKLVLVKKT